MLIKKSISKGILLLICALLALSTASQAFAFNVEAGVEKENVLTNYDSAYFLDCSLPNAGDGSIERPFNSLAEINSVNLEPGESVLFKRGSTCLGQFAPSGSGTDDAPIIISAYGEGTENPIINANGETNAVLLKNMAYVQMSELEIVAPGDNRTPRRGVYVLGEDAGDLHGVVLHSLKVHDVRGQMPSTTGGGAASSTGKFGNASGGIIIESQGSLIPTAFHDIQILNNEIYSVDRQGIYFWSNWCKRPELSRWGTDCLKEWYPNTDVLISGNELADIGGDGIVVKMTVGALVEHNTLDGFNVRSRSYNAGLWTANSDDVTFQFNRVTGGVSTLDGMAFDIDHATDNIIFQYNISHDNEGGFFLFCPDHTANTKNFIVRYNISINDREQLFLQGCGGKIVNGKIYNNTMYIGDGVSTKVYAQNGSAIQNTQFFNNIIYKTGRGNVGWDLNSTEFIMNKNVFHNISSIPSWATNSFTENPLFMNPGNLDTLGYRLGVDSPIIGAGVLIDGNGGRDFFGNIVSATEAPNIGAYEGAGVLATPEEGCLPALDIEYDQQNTVNWTTHVMVNVSNPCVSDYNNLTLSVSAPNGIHVSPSTYEIERLEPNEETSIELVIEDTTNNAFGIYPVNVSIANEHAEVLIRSNVNIQMMVSNWKVVSSENFNSFEVGAPPDGWTISGSAPPVVVVEGDAKALKLVKSSTVNRGIWSFPAQQGTLKLSAKIKAAQTNTALGIHYLDSNGGEVLKLSMSDIGKISFTNSGNFVNTTTSYEINKWHLLEAIVDWNSSSYIILLDGINIGNGTLGPSENPISQLRLQVPTNGQNGVYLVDEVTISVPDETVPIEPEPLDFQALLTGPSKVKSGDTLIVHYGVENAESQLTAQDVVIHYDSNLLEYVSVKTIPPGIQIVNEQSETPGVLRILIVSEGLVHAVNGDQPDLLELTFKAKDITDNALATVEVNSATFGDAEGIEYFAETTSYDITIEAKNDPSVIGDLNGDNKVTIGDLAIVAAHYGKDNTSQDWESIKAADINDDGKIDVNDLIIIAQRILE